MLFEQPDELPDIPPAVLAAMIADRLAELERLRAIGMKKAMRLEQAADGELTPEEIKVLLRGRGIVKEFERVCKAIRHAGRWRMG